MLKLQNHALVEESLKVQDKPIDFNVTEYKESTDVFRLHTATITYWVLVKYQKEYPRLSEKVKYSSLF